MSTTEAPTADLAELPENLDWKDERLCHLYRPFEKHSMCGKVPHEIHSPTEFKKGATTCPGCGAPICVECLLIAS